MCNNLEGKKVRKVVIEGKKDIEVLNSGRVKKGGDYGE